MWPSSAAPPAAPRTSRPLQTMPPPMPVPTVSITASSHPSAAPWRHSASIEQLPSLSMTTGMPSRSSISAWKRTPSSGRCGQAATMPLRVSSAPGMPKPTPSTGVGAASAASRTMSASTSSSSLVPRSCEERWARWCTARSASTAPARSFVPPTSTPMTHAPATGGTIPGRWLPTRRRRIPAGVPHTASTAPRRAGSRAAVPRWTSSARARRPRARARPGARGAAPPPRRAPGAPAVAADPHVGGPRARRLGRALRRALPVLRAVPAGPRRRRHEGAARRRDRPGRGARDRPHPRLRPAHRGHEGTRRQHVGAEPLGLHAAHAGRRRAQREALDPARHDRRDPGPRPQQDQRRLRDRRLGARGADGQAVPRDRDQPRDPRELREVPRSSSTRWAASTTRAAASSRGSTAAFATAASRCG